MITTGESKQAYTWTNTVIKNHHIVATSVQIVLDGTVAFASHKVGNVLGCDLTLTVLCEGVLARLLTDLAKRGFLNIESLIRHLEEMKYGPPVIDNVNMPCTHNVLVDHVCVNCGTNLKVIP
jgi:hypothetical protein